MFSHLYFRKYVLLPN